MKTKLMLLLAAVLTLGSLSSCVVPYGTGYGYNNYYRPGYYGGLGLGLGYGGYNNYYGRPGYAYSGYRSPYYGRPGYVGYRPGFSGYRPGYSGYRGGGFTHVGGVARPGGFGGGGFGHPGGFGGGFHGGGFHHR